MNSEMYIITVRSLDPLFRPERIDTSLSAFGPWFRFNALTWLVSTRNSSVELRQALKLALSPTDSFVVLGVDPLDRQGYAPADFWNWLDANSPPPSLARHLSTSG